MITIDKAILFEKVFNREISPGSKLNFEPTGISRDEWLIIMNLIQNITMLKSESLSLKFRQQLEIEIAESATPEAIEFLYQNVIGK